MKLGKMKIKPAGVMKINFGGVMKNHIRPAGIAGA
jgi:hypothetical protein